MTFARKEKRFAIVILFFIFSVFVAVFGRTGKSFLFKFRQLFL